MDEAVIIQFPVERINPYTARMHRAERLGDQAPIADLIWIGVERAYRQRARVAKPVGNVALRLGVKAKPPEA